MDIDIVYISSYKELCARLVWAGAHSLLRANTNRQVDLHAQHIYTSRLRVSY